jgi:hypothetical protein
MTGLRLEGDWMMDSIIRGYTWLLSDCDGDLCLDDVLRRDSQESGAASA